MWVHSNLPRVELFLNDRSLGERRIARDGHASWSVPYAPGRLVARGYPDDGAGVAAETVCETTGPAAAILLEPDRATIGGDGEDVSLVTVRVVDAAGRTVPTANATITFDVSGVGRLIGLGNGDPSSHEADKGSMRSVFNGLAQAIVQSDGRPGELRIDASSPELGTASAAVTCAPAAARPSA